jgi:splicing factor 3A subunit 1
MEGDAEDVPPSKRQRVAKLPGGQFYPEQDWINMHPVRLLFIHFWGV